MGSLKESLGLLIENYISPLHRWKRLADGLGDNTHLGHLAGDLRFILEEVKIPLPPHAEKFLWAKNSSRSFNVKLTYNLLITPTNDCYSWRKVWNLQLIPKIIT
ncbi:hypothetical protein SUGI_0410460 [Cryptomeria japonica]|nr:hypothetical protein SUGI_0410460 [Cryptomeria japonica]